MIFGFFIYLFVRAVVILIFLAGVAMFALVWIGIKIIALVIGVIIGSTSSSGGNESQAAVSDRR